LLSLNAVGRDRSDYDELIWRWSGAQAGSVPGDGERLGRYSPPEHLRLAARGL